MNLKTLQMLVDRGYPLHLQTEPAGDHRLLLRRDDGTEAIYEDYNPRESLAQRLAHYPQPVWINGERLETRPRQNWPKHR